MEEYLFKLLRAKEHDENCLVDIVDFDNLAREIITDKTLVMIVLASLYIQFFTMTNLGDAGTGTINQWGRTNW